MIYAAVGALAVLSSVRAADWNYEDPSSWGEQYPECDGDSQSPIDIISDDAEYNEASLEYHLTLTGEEDVSFNGHSLVIDGMDAASQPYSIFTDSEGASSHWNLAQFHFHWGEDDTTGSEHTVDGSHYPLEMHLVHWDPLVSATVSLESLMVVGVFFEIGEYNEQMQLLIDLFGHFRANDTSIVANIPDTFDVEDLLPEDATSDFWYYNGSLTTPTCDETVNWRVLMNTIEIDSDQLSMFRNLMGMENGTSEEITHNYRPVQPLNGRMVCKSSGSILDELEDMWDEFLESDNAGLVAFCAIMVVLIGGLLISAGFYHYAQSKAKAKKKAEDERKAAENRAKEMKQAEYEKAEAAKKRAKQLKEAKQQIEMVNV